jgi:lysophospholipase L1-like esterase
LSPGGAGGEPAPDSDDNVHFDANSFASGTGTVTVDATAYCLDMDWTGATNTPTLDIDSHVIFSGTLTIIEAMNIVAGSGLASAGFGVGAANASITTNGKTINANILLGVANYFSQLTLNDDLASGRYIKVYRGRLITNNHNITTTKTISDYSSTLESRLDLGSSNITCAGWSFDNNRTYIAPNTATINITGTGAFDGVASPTWITFEGDSLTSDGTYVDKVISLLGNTWYKNNRGTGGETTAQMLASFGRQVIMYDAPYVVIWGGINDITDDVAAVDIETNLQAMYTAAHNAGIKVVAVTISPFKGHGDWTAGRQVELDAVNTWINGAAINIDYIIDAFALLEDPGTPDTLLAAYDSGDHLHLSTAGYELIGQNIYDDVVWVSEVGYYNNVNLNGTAHTVSGSFTCTSLNGNPAIAQTLTFASGSNVTVTDATLEGTAGNIHTLTSSNTTNFTLTKAGGSYIELDYLNLSYSTASPVDTWSYGLNSTKGDSVIDWGIPRLYISIDGTVSASTVAQGLSVPDTSDNWTFGNQDVTPYFNTANITVGGVLQASYAWEYGETFTDLSGNGNDGTPSFRSVSSDADVSAIIASQSATAEQGEPLLSATGGWNMLSAIPATPGELYTEGGTDFPGGPELQVLADDLRTPYESIVYPIAFATAGLAGLLVFGATHKYKMGVKGSLFLMAFTIEVVLMIWVFAGGGVINGLVLIPFGLIAVLLLMIRNPQSPVVG